MVLTCTLGASVLAGSIDREGLRITLIAALGCNIAWGIIDAALYVMGNVFVRRRNQRLMQAIRSAPDDATALALVREALEPRVGSHGREKDRERFYQSLHGLIANDAPASSFVTADDLRSALAVFVLVVAAALPSALPFFLIGDPQLALRAANTVQVLLLFVVGFYWARSVGGSGWWTGLILMLSGIFLVGIAVFLGG
jgi:VIT1/CCC1 family predicted Fe2+/Mn2+ transporter